MITVDLVVEAEGWRDVAELDDLVGRAARAAWDVSGEASDADEVVATLLLADDDAIRALNRDWRSQDKPTNVLSFPSAAPRVPGEPRHLGDIALGLETVRREAGQEGKTMADHTAHLVVHGVLHLLGQDHGAEDEAEHMEGAERRALASLGIADPYADR